jgi:hypothetical protein
MKSDLICSCVVGKANLPRGKALAREGTCMGPVVVGGCLAGMFCWPRLYACLRFNRVCVCICVCVCVLCLMDTEDLACDRSIGEPFYSISLPENDGNDNGTDIYGWMLYILNRFLRCAAFARGGVCSAGDRMHAGA